MGFDGITWSARAARARMDSAREFIERFFPLIRIIFGQLGRGEELAALAARNASSQVRSVYYCYGAVILLARYRKTGGNTGSARPIPRFLPPQLTPLFLRYIGIAKPLGVIFARILKPRAQRAAKKAHWRRLFCKDGKRARGEDLRNWLRKRAMHIFGFDLKISSYLYAAIAWIKGLLKHVLRSGSAESDFEDERNSGRQPKNALDEQACRSSDTGEGGYGISPNDLADLTTGEGLSFRIWSFWRGLTGFPDPIPKRRMSPPVQARAPNQSGSLPLVSSDSPCLCAAQIKVARNENSVVGGAGATNCAGGEGASIPSGLLISAGLKRAHSEGAESACENAEPPKKRLRFGAGVWREQSMLPLAGARPSQVSGDQGAKLCQQLQKLFKSNDAEFKSAYQILATCMAAERKEDALIVMPAGLGKSLTCMLPAWMKQKAASAQPWPTPVTIVIAPLVSLTENLKRRRASQSLQAGIWRDRDAKPTISRVAVGIVGVSEFRQCSAALAAEGRLSRVVVEEARARLTW